MCESNLNGTRLDVYLVDSGMCDTRSLAKRLILDSSVVVNKKTVTKPSFEITEKDLVEILENPLTKYVSRGALKLEKALNEFNISPKGLVCIDIGASTGGFTDVLLQRGAATVYAVENGNGQLHEKLLCDKRVVSLENTNARNLSHDIVPVCNMAVMDVSFVSQTLFYPMLSEFLCDNGIFISLIKPQFEAGREHLNKKGIVKDEKVRQRVVDKIVSEAALYGFKCIGSCTSPIEGGDGNVEYLAGFIYHKRRDNN